MDSAPRRVQDAVPDAGATCCVWHMVRKLHTYAGDHGCALRVVGEPVLRRPARLPKCDPVPGELLPDLNGQLDAACRALHRDGSLQ